MIDYKKISRNIRLLFVCFVALVLLLVVLSECDLLPSLEGMLLSVSPNTMYIMQVSMFFLVGLGILAALKGFHWCLHHKILVKEGAERVRLYASFSYMRIALLGLLMLLGAFFYYATLANWGMYYGLAAFVVSFFCLPSAEGVEAEMECLPLTSPKEG